MSWVRLDDGFAGHRKVLARSDAAFRLEVAALCWCNQQANDGCLTAADVRLLSGYLQDPGSAAAAVQELVAAGLWEVTEGGYALHDYAKYQPSALERQASNEAAAGRMRKLRERRQSKKDEDQPQLPVTPGYAATTGVTVTASVTPSYAVTSREVLSSRPVPSRPDPVLGSEPNGSSPNSRARPKFLPPDFWPRFIARCGKSWGLPDKSAKHCEDLGLVVPMPQQTYLLNGAMEAINSGYTEDQLLRLADFVRLGGVGWRKAAWDHVSKNFLVELTKALDPDWDGVSDPRLKPGGDRAPQMQGQQRALEEARRSDEQSRDTAFLRAQLDEIEAGGGENHGR